MTGIHQTLFAIGDFVPFLYSLIAVVSIGFFKRFTSILFAAIVMGFGQFGMNFIRDPLWAFVANLDIGHAAIIWSGIWVCCNALLVWILHQLHVWGNVNKSSIAHHVSASLAFLSLLQAIKLADALFLQYPPLLMIYQLSIPAINIGLACYMFAFFIRKTMVPSHARGMV